MTILSSFFCTIVLCYPATQAKPTIPPIAQVLGFQVGYSTVEEVEKVLGPGKPSIGGHPNGRRTWFDAKNHVLISLDGFDYARSGRIIDGISIFGAESVNDKSIPRIALKKDVYGFWLGKLKFGMGMDEAKAALKAKGWQFTESATDLTLVQSGKVESSPKTSSTHILQEQWTTKLQFKSNRLIEIDFS